MNAQAESRTSPFLVLVIGVIIGLLIAGAFALVKSSLSKKSSSSTTENRGIVLSIDKPIDGDVVADANLKIEGTSGKDTIVAITGGTDNAISETANGKFSIAVTLSEGENELGIYAFDATSGESSQTTLSILYLKEELGGRNVLVAAANTEDSDKNKERIEKIRERLSTKSSELKKAVSASSHSHIVGTVTAINGTNLTLETRSGNLATVFTDDLTKFLSFDKGKAAITFSDLKIGDRVSVVGVGKDNTVGSARFVVRISKPAKRSAVAGKVKSIDGNTITLTHIIHTDRTFTVNVTNETDIKIKGKEVATLADVKVDDFIVAAGTADEKGTVAAKKIYVIPVVKTKVSTSSATPSSSQ